MVAFRLLAGDLLDYVRFRAVCTGWRSATASPRGRGVSDPRFHPRRWMMLPEGHGLYPGRPELDGYVRFLNLDTGTLVRVRIPLLLEDYCIIDSVDGLLLLLWDPDQEGGISLLHPFTGDTVELPPLRTLLPQLGSLFPSSFTPYRFRRLTSVVSASISFNAGAMTIMLELYVVHRLAYATSLDREWTLSSWVCRRGYTPLSFQGKLYMVDTPTSCGENIHQVFQIDPPVQDGADTVHEVQPPKLIATIPADKLVYPDGLVQCGSEILVVGHNDFSRSEIVVCKLADLVLQRFMPIKDIGGYTLFLEERNISVSSKILPTVKGDNVVFIHSGPPFLAQYNLSTGTLSPAIDDCSLYGHVPGPSSLVHYTFSCCILNRWSRGLIFRRKVDAFCMQYEA